jgi:predicted RNA-binding protein with PIN domain
VAALAGAEQKAGLAAGRRALASAIVASGVLGSHRVVVVYDASSETAPSEPSPHPSLALRFSRPPADADREILSLIARARGSSTGPITVVTADHGLSWECRKLGAAVIAPESWEPFRRPRSRKKPRGPAESSEKPRASAKDVEYWLEIFGKE